ncbi:MAG: Fe-S protein assembly co-chaperone HscB [Bdellovibrio bacteriovorus]
MTTSAVRLWDAEDMAAPDLPENYFELFDLPVAFALDARRLAERYRDLQAATRPERFGASAAAAHPFPLQVVAQVNEAYRTLKDPQERARYLLALHTGEPGTDSESSMDGSSLLEQLELRETLSEAQTSPNPGAALARVMTQLAERSLALDKELESLFADPSTQNLATAREILRKLQFLEVCRRDAEALEAGLPPRP